MQTIHVLAKFPKVREPLVKEAIRRLEENAKAQARSETLPLGEFLSQGLMNASSLLVLDLEKCTRCDECTKACADVHDGVTRLIREGLRFDKFLVASSCRSCHSRIRTCASGWSENLPPTRACVAFS